MIKEIAMIQHLSETRGAADHGWLKSRHTFSFGEYHNPERMGFGVLRVINDDAVDPGMGFGTHPHRDMEIVSIPLEGALQHRDSVGTSSVIKKGEVQIMSAGTGIQHSEFNASSTELVKFLQIWVRPKKLGVEPRYEQKNFSTVDKTNRIVTVVSPDGREGSITINQDAFFSLTDLKAQKTVSYERRGKGTGLYVFVISGSVDLQDLTLNARDGVGLDVFDVIELRAQEDAEVLLLEVPL